MPDWWLMSAWDNHRVPPNLDAEADRCPSNIMLRLPPCTKLIRVGFPIAHACIAFVDAQTMMIFFPPSKKTPDKGAFAIYSHQCQRVSVPESESAYKAFDTVK
jgi:hypothetical protein